MAIEKSNKHNRQQRHVDVITDIESNNVSATEEGNTMNTATTTNETTTTNAPQNAVLENIHQLVAMFLVSIADGRTATEIIKDLGITKDDGTFLAYHEIVVHSHNEPQQFLKLLMGKHSSQLAAKILATVPPVAPPAPAPVAAPVAARAAPQVSEVTPIPNRAPDFYAAAAQGGASVTGVTGTSRASVTRARVRVRVMPARVMPAFSVVAPQSYQKENDSFLETTVKVVATAVVVAGVTYAVVKTLDHFFGDEE